MASSNQVLDMSPIGMIFTVLRTSEETNNKSLDLQWELLPGCNMKDPLIHIHPNAVESYEILDGKMEFYIKDKWIKASKGDKLSVPIGVTHAFRNPGDKSVSVFNTHQPAFRMENYFEDVSKILNILTLNHRDKFRMNLRTMLYMSVLMNNYRREIVAINPPDLAIKALGAVAKIFKIDYQ